MPSTDSTAAIEAVYRVEFPRVVAVLAAFTGDIAAAEDLAQDAPVQAISQWPRDGTPHNPGAWLTAVGKRRAIDAFRRHRAQGAKYAQIGRELEAHSALDGDEAALGAVSSEEIDDDRLRVIFVACHPVLAVPARVALTLRLVGGLTVPEIARAYVVPEATIAQRIVRAKKAIARADVPFEVPAGEDRSARLGAVLEVIYLVFNEGYSATRARTGSGPSSAARRSASAACSPALRPKSPRCMASSPSWSSSVPACAPALAPPARRCCCSTRTATSGTASTSGGARPRWPGSTSSLPAGAPIPFRRPSLPATPAPSGPRRPTGTSSSPSTPPSPWPRPRPSSS